MKNYKYKAISNEGKHVKGTIEAYDEYDAANRIKQNHKAIVKLEEEKTKSAKINLNDPVSISEKSLSLICRQFAILLKSGLPASRTVEAIAAQCSDKYLKRVLQESAEDIKAGIQLSNSLENHSKLLPPTFIETIRAGEESGTLDKSFEKLSLYFEKSYKLKGKVRGAMIYPAFLAVLAIVVIIIVINVAVPTIAEIIVGGGGDIPGPTKVLMATYYFFQESGIYVLVAILAMIIAYKVWTRTEDGKLKSAQLALKLPVLGNINFMNAASQFAGTMTTLLSSGLPQTKALAITGKVMDNYAAGQSVIQCISGIEEGKQLGTVLRYSQYLPSLLTEMTSVGEESGSLEETLETIGQYYDSEVEQSTSKALAMLEPIITIFMGVIIGFIVIALYMPMFTMYNSY